MSDLEEEFKKVAKEAQALIEAKLADASAALEQATAISEQYGIPFRSGISYFDNNYEPLSFKEKFEELRKEVAKLTNYKNLPNQHGEYGHGWEKSDAYGSCYE